MKKNSLFFLLFFFGLTLMAQERNDHQVQTLFGNRSHNSNGGYGGFSVGLGNVGDSTAVFAGIKGGWIINHGLTIGIAAYGFTDNLNMNLKPGSFNSYITGGYGGLLIEPIVAPFSPIHLSIPIIFGAGTIAKVEQYYWNHRYNEPIVNDLSAFLIFQPGLEIEINVVSFMRIAAGASYRFASDIVVEGVSAQAMNGMMGHFTFKFGKF